VAQQRGRRGGRRGQRLRTEELEIGVQRILDKWIAVAAPASVQAVLQKKRKHKDEQEGDHNKSSKDGITRCRIEEEVIGKRLHKFTFFFFFCKQVWINRV
jgi:hypothetical protein